jgi:hypothetical protein
MVVVFSTIVCSTFWWELYSFKIKGKTQFMRRIKATERVIMGSTSIAIRPPQTSTFTAQTDF